MYNNSRGYIIEILDSPGNTVVKYKYDAWGNCNRFASSNVDLAYYNPIRYRSYYHDEDIGLYFLNARYYNPQWRRFISPDDTIYLDPETPNGLNLYCYCNNDPVNCVDPSGHMAFWLAAGLFFAAIGLICGATYAGITSYESGNRGWNLVGDIALGGLIGGIAGFAVGSVLGAGVSGLLTGSFVSSVQMVKAGAALTHQMFRAGGITAAGYMMIDNLSNAFYNPIHVFWSGGDVMKESGSALANSVSGITLEMTKLGQYLSNINNYNLWTIASNNFANQVSSKDIVYVVQNLEGMGINNIWATVEYPILINKSAKIIYIILGGR